MRWTGKRPRPPSTARDGVAWTGMTYSIGLLPRNPRGAGTALPDVALTARLAPGRPEEVRDRATGQGAEVRGDQAHTPLAHGVRLGAGRRGIHHDLAGGEREVDRPVHQPAHVRMHGGP